MSRCRFVQPRTVRVAITDGHWIEVKHELTAGEQRRVFGRMVREYDRKDGRAVLDPEKVGRTKISEYLVDWSLTDIKGEPVPLTNATLKEAAIDALDGDTYNEIVTAIDAHELAVEAERLKNSNGGETKSAATSPSAS